MPTRSWRWATTGRSRCRAAPASPTAICSTRSTPSRASRERAEYAPYLKTSDTAEDYGEGQIDPRGPGWRRNLTEQFERRKKQGFEYVELDNPDAYAVADVVSAVDLAASHGLKVIAK